jgi:hypothetical protein
MTTILLSTNAAGDYLVKLRSADPDTFSAAINTLKDYVSPTYRKYDPRTRHWTVARLADKQFRHWLSYAQHALDAQIEWLDGAADADPDREWTPPSKPKTSDPYTALWLLPGAPLEVVRAAYKALATLHHPDKPSGDDEKMKAINRAYQQLAA